MFETHTTNSVVLNNTWLARDVQLVVELAGFLVEGSALLDGAEAGDPEGLTGLGDGLGPAADVLVRATAGGVGLLGDDLAVPVLHQHTLGLARGFGLLAGSGPHLTTGSTDTDATGHFESLSLCAGGSGTISKITDQSYTEK